MADAIMTDVPGTFAWGVLHERHPALIERVRRAYPYPPEQQAALAALGTEITLAPLPADAHDFADWERWGREYWGRRWDAVPFFWAESYFYRCVLEAVRFFRPGPWQGIDPFAPQKAAELAGVDVGELTRVPTGQWLTAALWGNRGDLGFQMSDPGARDRHHVADLIVDDSDLVWTRLADRPAGTVLLIADNAGGELLADLVLVDHLLGTGLAARVDLHVKPAPYFVSDATTADVVACLDRLDGELHDRLWTALTTGRLTVGAHPFYCSPLTFRDAPADLADRFAAATLTIAKGDLNYRRLVGDRAWPATASFAELTDYFPGPLVCLRTLKSDVVVGVDPITLDRLDAAGERWRTSGTHGMIQARG